MYSAISKFPFPVIASKPLAFLKLLLGGRLLLCISPNLLFVTQGGFPMTNISFPLKDVLIGWKSKSKKFRCSKWMVDFLDVVKCL